MDGDWPWGRGPLVRVPKSSSNKNADIACDEVKAAISLAEDEME